MEEKTFSISLLIFNLKRKHSIITKTFSNLDNVFFVIIGGLCFLETQLELMNGMSETEKLFANSQENDFLEN